MTSAAIRRHIREIKNAPICEPGPGEHVGECHWSRTGWGIWRNDGGCTCRPANPPAVDKEPPR